MSSIVMEISLVVMLRNTLSLLHSDALAHYFLHGFTHSAKIIGACQGLGQHGGNTTSAKTRACPQWALGGEGPEVVCKCRALDYSRMALASVHSRPQGSIIPPQAELNFSSGLDCARGP